MPIEEVKQQARFLAKDNRLAEPDIQAIYWFPDDSEVRLVEISPSIPATDDGLIHPFYFRASPADNLPAPSGIALIRPEEFRNLRPPAHWGDWDNAVALPPEHNE